MLRFFIAVFVFFQVSGALAQHYGQDIKYPPNYERFEFREPQTEAEKAVFKKIWQDVIDAEVLPEDKDNITIYFHVIDLGFNLKDTITFIEAPEVCGKLCPLRVVSMEREQKVLLDIYAPPLGDGVGYAIGPVLPGGGHRNIFIASATLGEEDAIFRFEAKEGSYVDAKQK